MMFISVYSDGWREKVGNRIFGQFFKHKPWKQIFLKSLPPFCVRITLKCLKQGFESDVAFAFSPCKCAFKGKPTKKWLPAGTCCTQRTLKKSSHNYSEIPLKSNKLDVFKEIVFDQWQIHYGWILHIYVLREKTIQEGKNALRTQSQPFHSVF